jgi:hypothetical protein
MTWLSVMRITDLAGRAVDRARFESIFYEDSLSTSFGRAKWAYDGAVFKAKQALFA